MFHFFMLFDNLIHYLNILAGTSNKRQTKHPPPKIINLYNKRGLIWFILIYCLGQTSIVQKQQATFRSISIQQRPLEACWLIVSTGAEVVSSF